MFNKPIKALNLSSRYSRFLEILKENKHHFSWWEELEKFSFCLNSSNTHEFQWLALKSRQKKIAKQCRILSLSLHWLHISSRKWCKIHSSSNSTLATQIIRRKSMRSPKIIYIWLWNTSCSHIFRGCTYCSGNSLKQNNDTTRWRLNKGEAGKLFHFPIGALQTPSCNPLTQNNLAKLSCLISNISCSSYLIQCLDYKVLP